MKMAGFMKGGNWSFINLKDWLAGGIHRCAKQQMVKRVEAIVGNVNKLERISNNGDLSGLPVKKQCVPFDDRFLCLFR